MWYHLFAEILDRGVVASVIILVVLIVRGAMCRFPKKYLYLLWMIVAVRLVCPIGVNARKFKKSVGSVWRDRMADRDDGNSFQEFIYGLPDEETSGKSGAVSGKYL